MYNIEAFIENMGKLGDVVSYRIRIAREAIGLTQAELGDALGISRDAISKIETGRSTLTLKHLESLPSVLQRPVAYFLDLPHELGLTDEEAEALELFRKLKPGAKQSALQVLRDLNQMVADTIREVEASYETDD